MSYQQQWEEFAHSRGLTISDPMFLNLKIVWLEGWAAGVVAVVQSPPQDVAELQAEVRALRADLLRSRTNCEELGAQVARLEAANLEALPKLFRARSELAAALDFLEHRHD